MTAELDQTTGAAEQLLRDGKRAAARTIYQGLLQRAPDHVPALNGLGQLAWLQGESEEALRLWLRSLAIDAAQPGIHSHAGAALRRLGHPDQSLACHERAIALAPREASFHNNRGLVLHEGLGRMAEALASFDTALALEPGYAAASFNKGNALRALGRLDDALQSYARAVTLRPDYMEAHHNRAAVLKGLGRLEEALAGCERVVALRPQSAPAHRQRANLLADLGRLEEALNCYERALECQPDDAGSWSFRGVVQRSLGRPSQALESFDRALAIRPDDAGLHNNRGNALRDLGRLHEALASYERALVLQPDYPLLEGQALFVRMELALWDEWDERVARLIQRIEQGQPAASPFPLLALVDAPQLHRRAAERYAAMTAPPRRDPLPALQPAARPGRLRIGYFSSDFGDHPVTHLLAAALEMHDKNRFEIFAFAFGPNEGDPYRQRVVRAVDRFIDISGMPDRAAAQRARDLGIDVAVDLNGFTRNARTGIFAERAAPVQIGYLGYLGTLGGPLLDYLIADATLVAAQDRPFYAEKVITLPCYQCNDRLAPGSDRAPSHRAHYGLPDTAFVFCSFNSLYKITPAQFAAWMRILQRVPRSVLWLLAETDDAGRQLLAHAARHGVSSARVVLARKVALDEHLARQRLADLFLDTHPYAAGTTASIALRAGVPVLTHAGDSFASRMAASLLQAVGLPELITTSVQAYEELAVQLASDRGSSSALRMRLQAHLPASELFAPERFTRHLESAYEMIVRRWRQGQAAEHVVVAAAALPEAEPG